MDITDNGAGGNVLQGVGTDVGGLLSDIESSLTRISDTLKSISTSFTDIQKGMKGGGGSVSAGNTGSGAPAMSTPGEGMGGGGGFPGGMAVGSLATMLSGATTDKLTSGLTSLYMDAIPQTSTALTMQQLNYQFGIYNGNGKPLIDNNAPFGAAEGMAADLLRLNPAAAGTSTVGYAELLTGLARTGLMGSSDDVTSRTNPASSFADLSLIAGISPSEAVAAGNQSVSPESEIAMLALGYDSPIGKDGSANSPFEIANEVLDRFTGGEGGFENKDEMDLQYRKGGGLWANFQATGQPDVYREFYPFIQKAKEKYESSGEPQGDWSKLDWKQRETITKDLTEVDNPDVNPAAQEGLSTAATALRDIGMTKEIVTAWNDANVKQREYLGYLSNLPYLEQIAAASGWNTVAQNLNTGLAGLIGGTWIGDRLGLASNAGGSAVSALTGDGAVAGTNIPLSELPGAPSRPGADTGAGAAVSNALGDWNVSADTDSRIHQGEMILPSRIAESVRRDLVGGGRPPQNTPSDISSTVSAATITQQAPATPPSVTINVSVERASEEEAVMLARKVQNILTQEDYLTAVARGGGY